jgi:hypothetical protein
MQIDTPVHTFSRLSTVEDAINRQPVVAATLLGLFAFISCFYRLFVFPGVPLLPAGDAVTFFVAGSRIAAGQLPYRDFFEILPVGSDLVYAALIRIFGFYTWLPGAVMACLAAGIVAITTMAASKVMRGIAILLPGLLLTSFALSSETLNATHHWFCTLAAMAAVLVLMGGVTTLRVVAAGALAGLAACFTQTSGAALMAALAFYIALSAKPQNGSSRWRKVFLLCAACVAVFAAVNGHFIWRAGLHNWFFWTIVFPARYFGIYDFNNWRVMKVDFQLHRSMESWILFPFIYVVVPLAPICILLMRRRERRRETEPWNRLLLLALAGVAMFLALVPAPSLLRLSSAGAPAMILLAWMLSRGGEITRRLSATLGAAAILIGVAVPIQHQARWRATLDLPGGRTAFFDPVQYQEYGWLARQIQPGDYFFGANAMYVAFQVINPAPVAFFDGTDYTRPEHVAAGVRGFQEHDVPLIVLKGPLDDPAPSASDHSAPFRDYVRANYLPTKTFANADTVWQRIDHAGALSSPVSNSLLSQSKSPFFAP